MRKATTRRAITFFELLVILAILGLLLALLIPAVARVRGAANRMTSSNNLKQMALACHNYHDTYNHFPPGNDKNNFSAAAYLLPFIEQANLYNQIDFKKSIADDANSASRQVAIKIFLSPQDPQTTVNKYGATNYLFNAGSNPSLDDNNGIFYQDSKIRITDVLDGTSNTTMICETLKGDGQNRAVTVQRQYVVLKARDALEKLNDQSGVKEWKANKDIRGDRCASWMDGRFLQGTYTATREANSMKPDVAVDGGYGGLSSMRTLSDVLNCAFCDGSVHAIRVKIDPKVWKLLSSRADGQVINSDDF